MAARLAPLRTTAAAVTAIGLLAVVWAGRPTRDVEALGVVPARFVGAMAGGDVEALEHDEALVVEGSPAAAYAAIALRTVRAVVASGVQMPQTVTVQPIDRGLDACADVVACSRFTGFELADDGRVRSFVVDGVPVEAIVGGDERGGPSDPTPAADPDTTSTSPPPTTVPPPTTTVPVSTTVPPPPPPRTTTTVTVPVVTTVPPPPTTVTVPVPTSLPTSTVPDGPTAPTFPTTRNLARWPFSADSPWNMPVGSSAVFAPTGDPRNQSLGSSTVRSTDRSSSLPVVTWVNATSYSIPVFIATEADPLVEVRTAHEGTKWARIPGQAVPAAGSDSNMAVIQPDGTTWDVWTAKWIVPGSVLEVGRAETTGLAGSGLGPQGGIRASGLSSLGGLIRRWEVDPTDQAYTDGVIRHAVALSLPSGMLRYDGGPAGYDSAGYGTARGYVWPATEQDYDSPWTYGGTVPMGTMVAIPRSVDLTRLGLGPEALALARALQDYGGYVVDRAGDGSVAFYAEPTVPAGWSASITGPTWTGKQLSVIRQLLQVVANNGPGSIGGGGVPAVPVAPGPS